MSKKVFVSYKHKDTGVQPLQGSGFISVTPTARDYVDALEAYFDANDFIYKGERGDENLAQFKDETIESQLRNQIYDSSVTLILISKNMFDRTRSEDDQWIPWEISYSLKEISRDGRVSHTNAALAVILPDESGSYNYFIQPNPCGRCINWRNDLAFQIIGNNMFNRKSKNLSVCGDHAPHVGIDHSYIFPVKWHEFKDSVPAYINYAVLMNENIDDFEVQRRILRDPNQ